MKPTAIGICAGAGGLDLGLERAGFVVHGVERDADAVATYRRNVGPCDLADVTTWHPPGDVDLVAGGVPCQPYSAAGRRLGLYDPRGSLFRHLVRIGVEANARCIMLENVVGLATWERGRALREVLLELHAAGFPRIWWGILDAADFGVPQHRRRLLVVACRGDARGFEAPEPTHGPEAATPWVTVRQALGLSGDYVAGQRRGAGFQGVRSIDVDAPGYTVGTKGNADWLVPADPVLDRPAQTITSSTHDETPDPARPSRRYGPRLRDALAEALAEAGVLNRPATSIQAGGSGRLAAAGHHAPHWKGAVRLTVEQCAILQDFPPGFSFVGNVGSQHRQVGNAVPRGLAEAMGRSIRCALRGGRRAAA